MDEKRRMHDCLWVYDDDGSEISYIGETEAEFYGIDDLI